MKRRTSSHAAAKMAEESTYRKMEKSRELLDEAFCNLMEEAFTRFITPHYLAERGSQYAEHFQS